MPKSASGFLLPVLILGLAIRLTWAFVQPIDIDRLPDQREYLSLGKNLLAHHSLGFVDPRFGQTVVAYRMPGYPLFIAACGGSVRRVRIVQALIDASTLLAVFLLAARVSQSEAVGVFAAGVMAINPFYVYFSSLILTETLFAALIAWATWFLFSGRWGIAMMLFIASVYVRPTGLLFLPLLLLANPASPAAYRLSGLLLRAVITTLVTLACLFPWAWRNHKMLDAWTWTTTNTGVTLYDGFNPAADGSSNQRFVTQLPGLRSINEVERSRFLSAAAKDWICKHLSDVSTLSSKKVLRGWSPIPLSAEFSRPMLRWISAMYALPFDVLCLAGLFSGGIPRRGRFLMLAPAVIVTLAQVMSVGSIRYRMPAESMLAVLVAMGSSRLFGSLNSNNEISNIETNAKYK